MARAPHAQLQAELFGRFAAAKFGETPSMIVEAFNVEHGTNFDAIRSYSEWIDHRAEQESGIGQLPPREPRRYAQPSGGYDS